MFQKPFVVLDLETSGIDPKNNEIIEIALIRYEKGKETARFESLVKIDFELPRIITAITGITAKELKKKGRPRDEVFAEAAPFLEDAYLVGHNIKFDVGFLKAKGFKLNVEGLIDTVPLAQIVMPEAVSYSLESLAEDLNLTHEAHRAMGDVEATLDLFKYLMGRIEALPADSLEEIQGALLKSEWEGGVVFAEARGDKKVMSEILRPAGDEPLNDMSRPSKALEIEEIFGKGGAMERALEGYESRPQQAEMAKQVMNAFDQGYHLICEAPTGVGKSLAYLAAASVAALKNKSKVVISTNTLNLQEQLFTKDLPLLDQLYKDSTGQPGPRVAMLKGRSHYLCLRRLAEFKRRPRFTVTEVILLVKILVWQAHTAAVAGPSAGDSAEIHITREEQLVWDFELCSDKKYCSPVKCQRYGKCYLHQAREMAEAADIIIANHALLCADLQSGGGLLPEYQYLVIDEAHHFEEASTHAFETEVSQESVALPLKLIQNHLRHFQGQHPEVLKQSVEGILEPMPALNQLVDNFFSVVALFVGRNVPDSGYVESLLVDRVILGMPEWLNLESSMQEVGRKLSEWTTRIKELVDQFLMLEPASVKGIEGFTDELLQEIEVVEEQLGKLRTFFGEDASASIRWMTCNLTGVVSLHLAPLIMGPLLKTSLYDQKKSIVLTSATLSVSTGEEARPFIYLRQMLGLDERFEEVILDSPFNFEAQSYVLLPNDALPLTASRSMEQVSEFFAQLIGAVGGGTLGLFTSYSAIETVYLALMDRSEVQKTKILAQRVSGGRNKIMKAYMNDPLHSVLFGTASFWEGVDIQGNALTTLVIHKLPFDVPSEPIFKARQELFSNSFMEYSVPRAILRFKQGFGRLIRSKKDYGALVVLDNRVTTKDFGQLFLQALPKGIVIEKMKLMEIPGKIKEWLKLTKS